MPRNIDHSVWQDGLNEISIATVLPLPQFDRTADPQMADTDPAIERPVVTKSREAAVETWQRRSA